MCDSGIPDIDGREIALIRIGHDLLRSSGKGGA